MSFSSLFPYACKLCLRHEKNPASIASKFFCFSFSKNNRKNRKITFVPCSKFLVGYYFSTPYAIKLFLSARCIPKLCIFQTFGMTTTKLVINGLKLSGVLKDSNNNSVILFGDSLIRNFQMTEIDKVCLPEDVKISKQSFSP